MTPFQAESIRLALQKMFRPGGHFSICTVDQCLRTAGIEAPREAHEELRPLHCVDWSEMTPEMREEVMRRVLALFSLPETELGDLSKPLIGGSPEGATSLFQRLLGRGSADA